MNNNELQEYFLPEIVKLRFILMLGAILYTYSLHSSLVEESGVIFGFVFPALYIISGYIVLRNAPDIEKRILRAIGRTAICFVILCVVYFLMSLAVTPEFTLALIRSKTFWINFLIFNICSLPIGSTIWFVQALLYAYIIIYIIYKLKLLKLDIYIAVLCLIVTILTGELSSVVGFHLLGRTYIGGNFLTRALPYILIGCFISRKSDFFNKFDFINFVILATVGIVLTVAEFILLKFTGKISYSGHMFGMGIVAVAICLLCFFVLDLEIQSEPLKFLSRTEFSIPFFICSPVYYFIVKLLEFKNEIFDRIIGFAGIFTLIVTLLLFRLYVPIRYAVLGLIYKDKK